MTGVETANPTSKRRNRVIKPGRAEVNPVVAVRRETVLATTLAWGVPTTLLLIWQFASSFGLIDSRVWPSPIDIFNTAIKLSINGDLWPHLSISLYRLIIGYVLGIVAGIIAGILLGVSKLVRMALEPTLSAIYTIPKLALLPIFMIIFGFGETPKVAIIAVSTFFFVWLSTMAAIISVESGYREAAWVFEANRFQILRHVLLPASLPAIFVGLRIAAGVSVLTLVAIEFIFGRDGIGFVIFNSRALLLYDRMFVGIVLSAGIGVVFMGIVKFIGKFFTPWAASDDTVVPA